MEDIEEHMQSRRMKPKLNRKNADLGSDSSYILDSSDEESNSTSSITESKVTTVQSEFKRMDAGFLGLGEPPNPGEMILLPDQVDLNY